MSTGIVGELLQARTGPDSGAASLATLQRFLDQLGDRIAALEARESAAASVTADQPASSDSERIVLNRDSKAIHRTAPGTPIEDRVTYCGWRYAGRKYSIFGDIPAGTHWSQICPRCLKIEREFAKTACGDMSDPE